MLNESEIVRIYKSYVEPWDKHLLWMRPCLPPNKGYDLLYWQEGEGWVIWIKGCHGMPVSPDIPGSSDVSGNTDDRFDNICDEPSESQGHTYEIERPPCGCK